MTFHPSHLAANSGYFLMHSILQKENFDYCYAFFVMDNFAKFESRSHLNFHKPFNGSSYESEFQKIKIR